MLDFSGWLNLPIIWGGLIATAVFLYVALDGFDLGCGILFPFAPSEKCRSRIMNSIAPFWDGNETWLVLGGGGLFVAFPVAYAVLLPALYIPVMVMLIGLILRGVAFEFRFKAPEGKRALWDGCFHIGSTLAAFMQGMMLGNFIEGVSAENRAYTGGPMDWANAFAFVTGIFTVCGYAFLGATWVAMKTTDDTQDWARRSAKYVMGCVAFGMILVSAITPFLDDRIAEFWFTAPTVYFLLPAPLLTIAAFWALWKDLSDEKRQKRPFVLANVIFLLAYIGVAATVFPYIVPYAYTLEEAAASPQSQTLMLIGALPLLPIILGYTAYAYYVFRGKSGHEAMY